MIGIKHYRQNTTTIFENSLSPANISRIFFWQISFILYSLFNILHKDVTPLITFRSPFDLEDNDSVSLSLNHRTYSTRCSPGVCLKEITSLALPATRPPTPIIPFLEGQLLLDFNWLDLAYWSTRLFQSITKTQSWKKFFSSSSNSVL